jgi:hypothetical protein
MERLYLQLETGSVIIITGIAGAPSLAVEAALAAILLAPEKYRA